MKSKKPEKNQKDKSRKKLRKSCRPYLIIVRDAHSRSLVHVQVSLDPPQSFKEICDALSS